MSSMNMILRKNKAEEERFFRRLREEQNALATGGSQQFNLSSGRTDIEDMEMIPGAERLESNENQFRSTVGTNKKVTFVDTLNDRASDFHMSRPKSAKSSSKFDTVLSKESLTGQDYAEFKTKSKGKPSQSSITVPRPFKFDTREKIRPKSIRERKVDEMIAEKQLEEDRVLDYKFRARQPNKDIVMPLFDKINKKNEQRRKEVKETSQKLLKEKERPFSFYERDKNKKRVESVPLNEEFQKGAFKANPIPTACTVEIFKVMMDKQDKERQDRIKKNAEVNFRKSKLPPRMQMHENLRREKEENSKKENKSVPGRPLSEIGTFRPPRARPIPNFEKLQRSFQESLDRK